MSQKGSVLGGILLITGCCIGAGMLGMPVITATAGVIPTTVAMLICCLFMNVTGLLLLEAVLWFKNRVNLITLSNYALGSVGQVITWISFVFLFYCLCVAYTIGCGDILGPFLGGAFIGRLAALTAIGILIYIGTRTVDHLNRILMVGLIFTYCLLVISGAGFVQSNNLVFQQWPAIFASIPLLLISFGYQNLIPSLAEYLQHNVKKITLTILGGTLLTFLFYLVWEIIILGILPFENAESVQAVMNKGEIVTDMLQNVTGIPYILPLTQSFALFAIMTSLLANSLTCLEFLQDGLRRYVTSPNRFLLVFLVLLPPLIIAQSDPHLFLKALSIAGGTATVILFGIFPALIVWYGRYRDNKPGAIVPGGKPVLILVIAFSLTILTLETARLLFQS